MDNLITPPHLRTPPLLRILRISKRQETFISPMGDLSLMHIIYTITGSITMNQTCFAQVPIKLMKSIAVLWGGVGGGMD